MEKAVDAANRIHGDTSSGSLIPAECDLASFDSIKKFANDLSLETLDVVCLNAGLSLDQYGKEIQRTKEGFELTGKWNHWIHEEAIKIRLLAHDF